jgi:ribonuclease P protein subunit RPR2
MEEESHIKKEKKLSGKQKLALERIYRLFEVAEEMQESKTKDKEKYVKKYLQLAKRIGEKTNVSIPKELKKKYCNKCFGLNVRGKEKTPFFVITCENCGAEKKFSAEKNKYSKNSTM